MNHLKRLSIGLLLVKILISGCWAQSQSRVVAANATISDRFPKVSGVFRMSDGNIALGRLKKNEVAKDTLWLWNADSVSHTISAFSASKCLRVMAGAALVPPRTSCWVALSYDGACNSGYGFFMERFTIKTDDPLSPMKPFTATIRLEEYFPPMSSEDSLMTPRARASATFFDFGKLKPGIVSKKELMLFNDGKRDLVIRQALSNQPNIHLKVAADTVKAGSFTVVTIELNTAGRSGRESSNFELHVNAPFSPMIRCDITYVIE